VAERHPDEQNRACFAHFGSREELQISVIREYHNRFEQEVFYPAMSEPRGLPRLRAMFANWMKRTSIEIDSGCLYISGAVEFDDREGPVRDATGQLGLHLAFGAQARDPGCARTGPPFARGQRRADAVRDPRPDPGPALRSRLLKNPDSIAHANAGFDSILAPLRRAAADRLKPGRSTKTSSKE